MPLVFQLRLSGKESDQSALIAFYNGHLPSKIVIYIGQKWSKQLEIPGELLIERLPDILGERKYIQLY